MMVSTVRVHNDRQGDGDGENDACDVGEMLTVPSIIISIIVIIIFYYHDYSYYHYYYRGYCCHHCYRCYCYHHHLNNN